MKKGLLIAITFILCGINAKSQCPYIAGVLADASNVGTPTGEGKNEFVIFNTGSSSINVNTIFISYGTTTTSTAFSIDGAAVPNVWVAPTTPGLLTNSAGTITQVTTGSIPANRNVVVISKDNAVNYNFQAFGADVYVLSYDQALAGVSGFLTAGRFPNTGATDRYFRINQGGVCNDTVSYIPDSLFGGDGAGVVWDASGIPNYQNTGASGVILPIELLSFEAKKHFNTASIKWTTSGNSTEKYFEIERSNDGIVYNKIAEIPSKKANNGTAKEYSFSDKQTTSGEYYYRIRMIDVDGSSSFSPTNKISYENNSLQQINLYPNPVNNQLFFSNTKGFTAAIIVDFLGKIILEQTVQTGNNILELDNLAEGVYLLQLKSSTGIENHKIIKE